MKTIQIDKNIPIPIIRKKGLRTKYPFMDMEIGDSFLFDVKKQSSIITTATRIYKRTGRLFTSKRIDENNGRVRRME